MNDFTRHSSLALALAGSARVTRRVRALNIEHCSLIIVLLIAFFFRTYELAGLGLGLEHDEVAEWQIADGIRHGENALFFKEAYGQEPMFLYLMAGSTALIGDNVIGVRFTSVFVAMLTLAASYRMLRRMFSPLVALIALAGMSIALWPVFWGRVGLRAMTLPLTMCLAFDGLWRGLTTEAIDQRLKIRDFVLAGVFFGLSAYTYLSSRALPILLVVFTLYLAVFAGKRMSGRKWRGLFISCVIGALIALPLVIAVLTNPDLQFRVSEVSEPLDKALQGDTREVMDNIPRAFGMFTQQGDNTVRDNWPDRPVFPESIVALLFMVGFFVALTRFTQPRYALCVIWIGAMLVPTIVTTGAPNFTRTLGALPMVFAMPGIAVEWLSIWPLRMFVMEYAQAIGRVLKPIALAALLVVFGINAVSTYQDYFVKWPNHPETQFVFQADFAAIAKDIDASDVLDVSVGGLSNDTLDDPSLYLLRQRKDVRVRWFDSGSPISSGGAILLPSGGPGRVYVPSIVPVALSLMDATKGWIADQIQTDHFLRFYASIAFADPISLLVGAARRFDGFGDFLPEGTHLPAQVAAGSELQLITQWAALRPTNSPRRIFVHLVDPSVGRPIAQHDGLDSPPRFWQFADWLYQQHNLVIPPDTPSGRYELWLGIYDPTTGTRIMQTNQSGTESLTDHFVLGTIEVTR
jgi:4-amino-4-deoxy-L-arabinose transferase-like glycosyltransferase